ncbi:hypothetical protein ACJIZ3_011965 [Penstemon smallii]|uniref:Uncharacterized protein n=1 Tax=Penstemon smallii TaxID=265156 RepID=A0ABD3UQ02_9LAMI
MINGMILTIILAKICDLKAHKIGKEKVAGFGNNFPFFNDLQGSTPSAITAPSPIDTRAGSVRSTVSRTTDDPILAPNIQNQ